MSDALECLPAGRVAELLGVSRSQVYTLARRGQIPHQRAGRTVLFPRRALERWLEVEAGGTVRERGVDVVTLRLRAGRRGGERRA